MATDILSEKANGSWSLAMAELNKWLFLKAYTNRIDDVAERRALAEAKAWLDRTKAVKSTKESALLKRWKSNPPESDADWKWWIAIHQRHLFLPHQLRGAFYQKFPAIRVEDRMPDYELTLYFYEALRTRAK